MFEFKLFHIEIYLFKIIAKLFHQIGVIIQTGKKVESLH